MKKIFLIFTALLFSFSIMAEITNLEADVDGTNADFYWQGDTTLSKVYELDLLEGSEFGYIAAGAWNATVFDMGQGGWMWMTSDLLLAYGNNYSDLESAGASANVVAAWKANWEAAVVTVNNAPTLKPGEYVIVIEGYDEAYENVTESMVYEFFEIAEEVPTSLNPVFENKTKSFKIMKGDKIYIMNNNVLYDTMGRRVK